jgi:hypothetical protein
MAKRKVFFSFHYDRDINRIGQIRNSGVIRPEDVEPVGWTDAASWESIERQGDDAIKRWIDSQLNGTSVTVVLIGAQTASRRWVTYEIQKSHARGNGMLGVYIHNVKNLSGATDVRGNNPFGNLHITSTGQSLEDIYPTYDWLIDNGRTYFENWIEEAARKAGK